MQNPLEALSPELETRMSLAEDLAQDERLLQAFGSAVRDPDAWNHAEASPEAFLQEHGIEIPEGLGMRFLRDPLSYPAPDYDFFTIRLFRCRSYWVKKKDAPGYEQVTVCFGFEVMPNPVSPIG
jgi:hypothetical protein